MKNKARKITFFLTGAHCGGGERVMINIASFLAEDGYQVDLVLVNNTGPLLNEVSNLVRVVDLKAKKLINSLFSLIFYLKENKPFSIISTTEHTHLISIIAKRISGVNTRVVLRVGIPFSIIFKTYKSFKDKLIPVLAKIFFPKADFVISVSKGLAKDFIKTTGVKKEKVNVVYHPKFIEDILEKSKESVDHKWFANKKFPIIISVGRLREQKDFETLIRSFELVLKIKEARLVIIGDGERRSKIEKLIKNLNLQEKVLLLGFQENPFKFLSKSDIFVLSSTHEGLPSALIESLVCGLPSISTDSDSGGSREILSPDSDYNIRIKNKFEYGKYGILVPVKDEEKMSDAIIQLLKNNDLYERYKNKAIERSKHFDKNNILEEYKKYLT